MPYEVKVLADSISPSGDRLWSAACTYPRMVHAELLTHRTHSRNAASSRAIPVKKLLSQVHSDPVWPVWWGKNQSGMQAREELTGLRLLGAKASWVFGREMAWLAATLMSKAGAHKQLPNRLIEPYSYITTILSGTQWSNFWALRTHEDAQPELRKIAVMMKEAYDASTPTLLDYGQWHLPLILPEERDLPIEQLIKISTGRCARVSYLTHDGRRDISADITLYERLLGGGHMSPTEHVARPMTPQELAAGRNSNFVGWWQHRKDIPGEADYAQLLAEAALL